MARFRGNQCGTCSLGDDHGNFFNDSKPSDPVRDAMILYRVADGAVERIRIYSTNCSVDGSWGFEGKFPGRYHTLSKIFESLRGICSSLIQ